MITINHSLCQNVSRVHIYILREMHKFLHSEGLARPALLASYFIKVEPRIDWLILFIIDLKAGCRITEIHLLCGGIIPLLSALEMAMEKHADKLGLTWVKYFWINSTNSKCLVICSFLHFRNQRRTTIYAIFFLGALVKTSVGFLV